MTNIISLTQMSFESHQENCFFTWFVNQAGRGKEKGRYFSDNLLYVTLQKFINSLNYK